MQFPLQFSSLTIPTGASPTSQHITINAGNDGMIKVYNSSGTLVDQIGGSTGAITLFSSTGNGSVLTIVSGANPSLFFTPPNIAPPSAWNDGAIQAGVVGRRPNLVISSPSDTVNALTSQLVLRGSSDASATTSASMIADTFSITGVIDSYTAGFNTYNPTIGNDGTATYSTKTGWWTQIGEMIYVTVYFVVNAAGSGAGIVTVDMPTNVYRGTRQTLTMHTESVGPNGSHVGNGECVFFVGGSGATADRLRTSSNDATNRDQNITGADLLAGGIIVIEGWYRRS